MGSILKFDNVYNVRDFGGHLNEQGKQVKDGLLFRGANLSRMNDDDRAQFADLNINLVIDFRYLAERNKQPSAWGPSHSPSIINYDDSVSPHKDREYAPHENFMKHELETAADAHGYMMNSYRERPYEPGFLKASQAALSKMGQTGDPIYVHCAAGKDRTGTFAAIVLMALGVDEQSIKDEYLLTRQAVDIEPILKMAAQQMSTSYGRPYNVDILRPFFTVEPEYLQSSLDVIGDFDQYWREGLGFGENEKAALRDRYLA